MEKGTKPGPLRRLAALLSLVCLAAALVVALVVLWGDVVRVGAAVLLIAVAVVGLWFAVSRKGAARMVGAVIAVASLSTALIVGFARWHQGLALVGAVLLMVASSAAARFALSRDVRTLRAKPVAGALAPRPAHPVLLMNPKSGGGKAEKFHLVDECRARGIESIVLQRGDDLLQLAEDAIDRGADVIGMAGGDGSQALVATVASKHNIPHVCVPAGTRNHFALDLGLDRDDVVGALDAFADGVERRIDLATVNGRVFVNNASLGLYAKIVQSPEYRDAKRETFAAMLPELLGPDAVPMDLSYTGPGGEHFTSAHMILVSNDPYQLDKPEGRGTRESMDLGMLGVVAAQISDAAAASRFAALQAAGQARRFEGWHEWTTQRFQVDSADPVEIGVDGEALRLDPPLVFESMPGVLRVRLPRHAIGLSPAARAVDPLSRVTLTSLARVLAGRPTGNAPRTQPERQP